MTEKHKTLIPFRWRPLPEDGLKVTLQQSVQLLWWLAAALLLCMLLVANAEANTARPAANVNSLGLAALLISDGHYQRAEQVLGALDKAQIDANPARYHTLQGLLQLHQQQWQGAIDAFELARKAGAKQAAMAVYLAQAHYQLGHYRQTLAAIEQVGVAAAQYPGLYWLRAQAHWQLQQPVASFVALKTAATAWPEQARFVRQQVFYLMELGAYREAIKLGRSYLSQAEGEPKDYLALAVALHRAGQSKQAIAFLEAARLRFPLNAELATALAQIYYQQGKQNVAANLYARAAWLHPNLSHDAAEFQRRVGHLQHALSLNSRVEDPKQKLRQRVSLWLAMKHYGQIASAASALERVGLMDDQSVRYALAYSYVQTGQFAQARQHLNQLTESRLVRQASQLRQYMQQCQRQPLRCQ